MAAVRPRLAVWKFASCDGCQLTLLDCEDELLALSEKVEVAHFREATRGVVEGPYDVSLVEGSISTPVDLERIRVIRAASRRLVTIGACATAGGVQALRNLADVDGFARIVYARPDYIDTLATSTPVSAHVEVDLEVPGCPIDKGELLETLGATLQGRRPRLRRDSVCMQCKLRGNLCLTVAHGTPCLGPVTRAGCGALCPSYDRGCYGCFGPVDGANTRALSSRLVELGMPHHDVARVYSTFQVGAPAFGEEARRHAPGRT
jgi:sulfhydrogenase subunit delta